MYGRWLAIGAVVGVGLMTKYTIVFFVAGILGGMLLTGARRFLGSWWFWGGAMLALLIFLPNLIWQVGGWPTLSTILTLAGAPLLSRFPRRGGDFDFPDLGRNVRNFSGPWSPRPGSMVRMLSCRGASSAFRQGGGNLVSDMTERVGQPSEKLFQPESLASAAKAVDENNPVIAAVNRCATQKQAQHRVFPQALKPCAFKADSNSATTKCRFLTSL